MADGISQTTIDDCVGDTLGMLDALKGLTKHSRDGNALRTMTGTTDVGIEPVKTLVAKAGQTLQELAPNSSLPMPRF
jgi:LysM repeat protein